MYYAYGVEYLDEHGQAVERTKQEYPYSYDGFVVWRGGKNEEATSTIYSDRLQQWDAEKTDRLKKKHLGNTRDNWSDVSPEVIRNFLREYLDKPQLKLILVMEYCHMASGYPLWRFDVAY